MALRISGNLDTEKERRQPLRTGQMTLSNQILHCKAAMACGPHSFLPLNGKWGSCLISNLSADFLLVHADPADLAEAFGNILDNAVKWAASEIEIKGSMDNGMVSVTISDDGPGIEEGTEDSILQRGVHLDQGKG
eukprot:gene59978-82054_t